MKKWVLMLSVGLLASCKPTLNEGESGVKTDLGDSGNAAVKKRYDTYLSARQHFRDGCNATTNLKRVIVTGFGLFSGVDSNISGAISNSMSDEQFFRNDSVAAESASSQRAMTAGAIEARDYSSRSKVRILELDNGQYEVCFLTLDVVWDLAAAIIINEARIFNPDLIVMSGLNGADQKGLTLEGGALNKAIPYSSYEADGRSVDITPEGKKILESHPARATIPMTWSNAKIAADIKEIVDEMGRGYAIKTPSSARSSNNYICNNVSYAVLAAMKGDAIELAGGQVKFNGRRQKAKAGFVHYPASSRNSNEEVAQWSRIMGKIIVSELDGSRANRARPVARRGSWFSRWWN